MPLPMYSGPELSKKQRPKFTLAIAAGKGGVGKSTVTLNLALAMQHRGLSVGILDSDIYGPSIRHMLPEDRLPRQDGEALIPALAQGIALISMAYFRKPEEAAAVRAPIANGVIKQFLTQVEWGPLDCLLIDFPPGTGDIQLTLAQHAALNAALLVSTPQELALLDVRKAADLFERVAVPVLGVVENMSYFHPPGSPEKHYVFGKGGGSKLAKELGVPLLGEIPLEQGYTSSADEGRSVFMAKDERLMQPFLSVAEKVERHLESLGEASPERLTSFELQW